MIFDDLDTPFEWDRIGRPPIYYANQDIRRMLNLAKVAENDVFFDLGSSFGQNILLPRMGETRTR
jgi:hypothetical protein